MKETKQNERIARILELILKLDESDFKARGDISDKGDDLDAVIAALNELAEKRERKLFYLAEQNRRINELVEVLLQYTVMDFSQKITISENGDELDAIALGLNTLGEELESHIRLLETNTAEITKKSEQLLHSNKQMEQFAYIASHDLQEPLRTLTNYVKLLQKEQMASPDSTIAKYLNYINNASVRMQLLITELLQYSRIGAERNVTEINCNSILQQVLDDLSVTIKESNADIIIEQLPVIHGYTEIKGLFQNIVSNAVKFRKRNVPLIIHISAKELLTEWLFAVKDNGIGIEQKYYDRIFSIFQKLHSQKEYSGTGIGLAQCKKIAELHGGTIWVESEHEEGSTFYFTISKIITT